MKILSVVGNRPQFIKSAPLSLALKDAGIDEVVLHTGQHYDPELSQVFFDELELGEPSYRLDLQTADPAAMEPRIREAIQRERPDWVLVYGDTNSTLAGAEAAVAAGARVAHVEAGLRSGDLTMPEERNRIEVDRISQLLFAPDERSRETLAREHVPGRIEVVGDVMRDALDLFLPHAPAVENGFVLATIHREANVQPDRLARIAAALDSLDARVVFPAHPRTRSRLPALASHVEVVQPLGYLELLAHTRAASAVVTDSGGLQKEAYWLGKPCVTLRPSTEWIDTVRAGANTLAEPEELADALDRAHFPDDAPELYGDGKTAERIAAALYA